MPSVLIIAETSKGSLKKATLNAITFAGQAAETLGAEFHVLVAGSGIRPVAEELLAFGPAKVHVADSPSLENFTAEAFTQVAAKVAGECDAVLIGAATTAMSKDFLPRLAGRLGAGMASDIIAMPAEGTFKRPIWAGSVLSTVEIKTPVKVVTIQGTAFDAATPGDAAGALVDVEVSLDDAAGKVRFVKLHEHVSERPELTEAGVVVAGGRGIKNDEGLKVIEGLADLLGAAVGATRAAVDAGIVPNDLQVGQTGKVVAPDLYFALGLSGAIQHLAGMKGSKVIVAVNKDPEAPIFQVADYGLVADLFKAVPELVEEIKKARA